MGFGFLDSSVSRPATYLYIWSFFYEITIEYSLCPKMYDVFVFLYVTYITAPVFNVFCSSFYMINFQTSLETQSKAIFS